MTNRLTSVIASRCRPQHGLLWFLSPAVSLWLFLILSACLAVDSANAANCDAASGAAAIRACDKELARDPDNIETRLRYADVLMGQLQYQQAVKILRDALELQPGNNKVKQKYRLASSLAEEQQSIDRQSVDTPAAGTRNRVKEILCKTLKGQRAINACDEVLTADSRNVTALTRRGDELMALNQVKDAVISYRRAVALDPDNPTLQKKLTRAESIMPEEPRVAVLEAPIVEPPIVEVPIIDEAAIATEKKRKNEEMRLAEEKSKEEAKKLLLARQEQKSKEAKLQESAPKVVVKYSNTSLANGSTY